MRRTSITTALFLAAAIALVAAPAPAGPKMRGAFQQVAAETDEDIYRVKLFPGGAAYACGTDGTVIRSSDGGATWEWERVYPEVALKVMHWPDERHGFFAGRFRTEDRYYYTTDGAKTFTRFRVDLPFSPQGFAFLNAREGWVIAGSSKEQDGDWRVTTDGGRTWRSPADPKYFVPARALFAIKAVGGKHLFAVGGPVERSMVGDAARCLLYQQKKGSILHSADEGATWETMDAGNPEGVYLRGVDFLDPMHGWVVGDRGFLATTTDGGKIWKVRETGTENRLRAVSAVTEKIAFVVGSKGTALATRDGGESWSVLNSRTKAHLRDCSFIDEKTGLTCGRRGAILRFARQY